MRTFVHPYRYPEKLRGLYEFIQAYHKANWCPPSYGDLATEYGVSRSVVRYWLDRMEEAKMIKRKSGQARGLKLLPYRFPKEDHGQQPTA